MTYAERKTLTKKDFALPDTRKYPIYDITHARNALARVSRFGTASEKRIVRAAVHKRYKSIK